MLKRFQMGLKGKLTFIIILAVIVSVGIVGLISIISMRNQMEKQIEESQMLLAQTFSEEVQQFFDDAIGMVKTATYIPAVSDVSSIPLIREDIKGVPKDVDVPKRETLSNIIQNYGDFRYMEQVTADVGNNIVIEPYEYQLDLTQLDFGHRDWFKGAMSKLDGHVSEVYISSSLNSPVIAIAHPTFDEYGKPSSVLMGALVLERLNELSSKLTFGKTGHAYMVDHQGTLAAHPNAEYTKGIKSVLDIPMVIKAMDGEIGVGVYFDPLVQKKVLSSYMPIGDTGWSMIVVQDYSEAFAPVKTTMIMVFAAVAILLLLAIFAAIFIAASITRPINRLVVEVGKMAEGDLTSDINIRSKDEIGVLARGLKTAIQNTHEVLMNINASSEQVAAGSKQVSDSSMALSQGAAEQASSVEQLTASLQQISSQTDVNAQNANNANVLAETAKTNAMQGNTKMQEMLKAMEEINESSANISKIIKVIDDIAFQTNILALNAAVEAARAGQHGKGFAVVAEEVRNLAARSASAAKETTDMIESSIKKSDGGTQIANETADSLNSIVKDVAEAATLVGDIALASNEQANAIGQINQGIMQVSQIVQSNSATAEEGAAASEELSSQADLLQEMVDKFKLKDAEDSADRPEELNLETLKMIEGIPIKEKEMKTNIEKNSEKNKKTKSKIILSDKEFGKY